MERVANSTPMVDFESRLNSLRVNRLRRLDLPTPESPIRTTGLVSSSVGEAHCCRAGSSSWRRTLEEKLQSDRLADRASCDRRWEGTYIIFVVSHDGCVRLEGDG